MKTFLSKTKGVLAAGLAVSALAPSRSAWEAWSGSAAGEGGGALRWRDMLRQ
ncbi:hypothetical protein OHT57_46110 [Streptomyces sp. NBC_00285]|uniref:hypothetical protein n=1 Tax=Streptomyces sp. NBC_00285 TaxID=2975700 RepID=UPI002E2C5EA1|nr:hypothetical protein [Streptomyces sp. NBC_00285]